MSRFLATAIALVAAMLIAGQSSSAADWKKIRIGTEGTYEPFTFVDASGQLQGFEIDLMKALCAKMEAECEFVTMEFDGIVPALVEGKIDAISTSMTITEKRKQVVAFSDKYYTPRRQFLTCLSEEIADISPEALKDRVIGTQTGTAPHDFLSEAYPSSDLKLYKSMDDAYPDLIAGRIDLIMASVPKAYTFLNSDAGKSCKNAGESFYNEKYFGQGVGVAMRKADGDLKAKFDQAIKDVLADGTHEAITKKYFPFSIY
jgi:lysine-arginine-ornithine-binding protein